MDREKLLAPRADTPSGLPEDQVEVPGVGTVRVRGLSRDEVVGIRKATDNDPATVDGKRALVLERKMIALAMIDPELSEADAGQWQRIAPAGELEPVTDKIQELSGLAEGATKSALPGAGERPGPGVRALPGDETVDDGGPAAPADQ
jgi:hypothetical protein